MRIVAATIALILTLTPIAASSRDHGAITPREEKVMNIPITSDAFREGGGDSDKIHLRRQ
jgi:hypothetical protein